MLMLPELVKITKGNICLKITCQFLRKIVFSQSTLATISLFLAYAIILHNTDVVRITIFLAAKYKRPHFLITNKQQVYSDQRPTTNIRRSHDHNATVTNMNAVIVCENNANTFFAIRLKDSTTREL